MSLSVVRWSLSVGRLFAYSLIRCSLFAGCWSLVVVRWSLSVGRCPLVVVRWSLIVVRPVVILVRPRTTENGQRTTRKQRQGVPRVPRRGAGGVVTAKHVLPVAFAACSLSVVRCSLFVFR